MAKPKTKASKSHASVRKSGKPPGPPRAGEAQYEILRRELERDHYGSYVMINTKTSEYVIAPTTTQVHTKFIEKFGERAPGWCTRIGVSVFVTI